jgi:hypothetical protein
MHRFGCNHLSRSTRCGRLRIIYREDSHSSPHIPGPRIISGIVGRRPGTGCTDQPRRNQLRNGAVTSAVLVHLRVEPAHFDWRWRERPALALLAWEALARDPPARLRRIQVQSIGTTINFRPAAITHRDIAASTLLIASRLAPTAALDAF